jgi:predicted ribosome-associated RNA-binding protein Tma20
MASIERFPMYEKIYFIDDANTQHKKEKLRGMLLLENNIKSTKNIILTNENANDKPMLIKQNRFKIIPTIKTAKYHTKNNTRNTTQKYNTKLKRTLHKDLLLTD